MSVAVHAAGTADDLLRANRRYERLLAYALAASVVLHALAAALAPGLRAPVADPPRPLEVVLVTPPQPPKAEPPPRPKPPPPLARAPAVKPAPQPKPRPVVPERKVLALPETAPAAPAFTVPQAPPEPAQAAAPVPAEPRAAAAPAAASPPAREAAPTSPPVYNAAYLGNAPPRYPLIARRSGVEGTVYVRVVVSREGRAAHVQVEKSSGSSALDNAALEAARGWKFAPARRGQEAVEQSVVMPFVFKLEGSS